MSTNSMQVCRYIVLLLFIIAVIPLLSAEDAKEEKKQEEQAPPASAEVSRETLLSERIEGQLITGETRWLEGNGERFLALFTESKLPVAEGIIIILHDLGSNLNSPGLIRPLRLSFPESAWHSLSVQLPLLEPGLEKRDYLPSIAMAVNRIETAVGHVQQLQSDKIVILGHGFGAAAAILYMVDHPEAKISAMVGLSIPGPESLIYTRATDSATTESASATPKSEPDTETDGKPEKPMTDKGKTAEKSEENKEKPAMAMASAIQVEDLNLFEEFEKLRLPLLDIYAQNDNLDVIRFADERQRLMRKTRHQNYQQIEIEGADHYFISLDAWLEKRIRGWLRKNARKL